MADDDTTKCCSKCKEVRPLTEFGRHRGKDHGNPACKACHSARGAEWYYRNHEKRRAQIKAHAAKIADRMKPYYAAYYQEHREKYDAINAAWYQANPDVNREQARRDYYKHREKRQAAAKVWRKENAEVVRALSRAYNAANPERVAAIRRLRKARKRNASGSHTGEDIKRIFKAQRGRCAYCKTSLKSGYHVDHITALARGGSNDPSNLQLLCATCNMRKWSKDPLDFARENGLLI